MKFQKLISFALVLALLVTTQAMAAARTAAPATGTMVLCVGLYEVTVFTDADGQPVATPHFCPDCLASDDIDQTPRLDLTFLPLPRVATHLAAATPAPPPAPRQTPPSRAPPVVY